MAIMGWSSAAMATRYQHVLDSILKGVAGQVGGLLWDEPERDPAADDDEDDGGDGTAGALVPA
jgi:integrase